MLKFLQDLNLIFPASGLSLRTIIFSLLLAFISGIIISFVYRKTNKGFSYEGSFNFTLIMVCLIITVIMITIGSNIALSLGLIGSLSIIRFRTAIKNSEDMAYLFWSIATGLAIGAQSYYMALACVVFIGLVIFFLSKFKFFVKANQDYVVVVRMLNTEILEDNLIIKLFDANNLKWKVRSSFADNNTKTKETTYSIYSKRGLDFEKLLDKIRDFKFVEKVSLLSPDTNLFI